MYNSNIGVFYDAPSVKDPDFYAFQLLQNMFGDYRIDKHASVAIVTAKDPDGLDLIRHSTAHLLAYAVKSLFHRRKSPLAP